MNVVNLIDTVLNVVIILLAVAVLSAAGYWLYRKQFSKKKKQANASSTGKEVDIEQFINLDDIKYDMYITNNYSEFTVGVRTNGSDYSNGTNREKATIISNYIEYVGTIDSPRKLFIQADQDNIESFINGYEDLIERYMSEYRSLEKDIKELERTYEQLSKEDGTGRALVERELNNKRKKLKNNEYIVKRIEHKKHYLHSTTVTDKRNINESYILLDYQINEDIFGESLTIEQKIEKARKELITKLNSVINNHSRAGVECVPLSGEELGEILRSTYNPLDGDKTSFRQLLQSNLYATHITGPDENTVKLEAFLKEVAEEEGS